MMISLIICTYNRDKYIYTTLEKIASNTYSNAGYEIVLVNNNSTDNTETECKHFAERHPQVCFRYFVETKQGLSHARNRGIAEAKGDILVFLDDDSFIKPSYLQNLANNATTHPDMMAFGGKIDPLFESGDVPKWLCKWTYSWVSAIDMGKETTMFKGNAFPIGANMGFRKSCLDTIGMFNTELGRTKKNLMGGEEKDIFNRAKAYGMNIYYFPNIEIQHVIPPTRTTKDYIIRLGEGVGMSEQLRCKKLGNTVYLKRIFSECIKWCGTIVLWTKYLFQKGSNAGYMLVLFRWNVTKGLLKPITTEKAQ